MLCAHQYFDLYEVKPSPWISETYVQLHLDSYGYFFMQAKTRPCANSTEPNWDQDFELELEGSQTLRILCYTVNREGEDELIGRSALEVETLTTPTHTHTHIFLNNLWLLWYDKSVIEANKLISFIGEKVMPNKTALWLLWHKPKCIHSALLVTYEICINSKTILEYHFFLFSWAELGWVAVSKSRR